MKQAWDSIVKYFTQEVTGHVLLSIIIAAILVVLLIVSTIVKKRIRKFNKQKNEDEDTRDKNDTIIRIIFDIINVSLVIITILAILQINGINVTSIITGLGIAGAVLGLALQDPLKDIIAGTHMMKQKFFSIGQAVKYNNFEGTVQSFTLRATKIIDYDENEIITVSNRNITEIIALPESRMNKMPIGLSYDCDPEKVHKDFKEIVKIVEEKLEYIDKCEYGGTNAFNESNIEYLIKWYTHPKNTNFGRRAVLMIVQDELNKRGYKLPYAQLDIHTK